MDTHNEDTELKSLLGKYECKVNCECRNEGFTQQMNEWCRSLGDCGMSVNVYGDLSDEGYEAKGKAPVIRSSDYIDGLKDKANDIDGQKAEMGFSLEDLSEEELEGMDLPGKGTAIPNYAKRLERIIGLATPPFGWFVLATLEVIRFIPVLSDIFLWVENIFNDILKSWFGIGDKKRRYAVFECNPWVA